MQKLLNILNLSSLSIIFLMQQLPSDLSLLPLFYPPSNSYPMISVSSPCSIIFLMEDFVQYLRGALRCVLNFSEDMSACFEVMVILLL